MSAFVSSEEKDIFLHQLFTKCVKLSDTGFNTGAWNMQYDSDLLYQLADSSSDDIYFRVYGWSPWAISLGANQKDTDIDAELLSQHGYDVVRRLTGGRAVFHANEITYSLVMRIPQEITIHDIYRVSHQLLLLGLQKLGNNNLSFQKSQTNFSELYKSTTDSVSCFASSARYEIMNNNRKVVGSAQRVYKNTLLQHGSILIGQEHSSLPFYVKNKTTEQMHNMQQMLINSSSSLQEVFGSWVTYQDCSNALCSFAT
ncbi:MAG: lipoate--protein ligase family protein [Candidatus Kapaibacterium sp.]